MDGVYSTAPGSRVGLTHYCLVADMFLLVGI